MICWWFLVGWQRKEPWRTRRRERSHWWSSERSKEKKWGFPHHHWHSCCFSLSLQIHPSNSKPSETPIPNRQFPSQTNIHFSSTKEGSSEQLRLICPVSACRRPSLSSLPAMGLMVIYQGLRAHLRPAKRRRNGKKWRFIWLSLWLISEDKKGDLLPFERMGSVGSIWKRWTGFLCSKLWWFVWSFWAETAKRR